MNGIISVTGAPNFIKETLKLIIANGCWHANGGKLQYSLLYFHSSSNLKISKKIKLSYIIDQLNLTDICMQNILSYRQGIHIFLHGTWNLPNIDLIIIHKETLTDKNIKRSEMITHILTNHREAKTRDQQKNLQELQIN